MFSVARHQIRPSSLRAGFKCLRDPKNSDTDYRVVDTCVWSFCLCIHWEGWDGGRVISLYSEGPFVGVCAEYLTLEKLQGGHKKPCMQWWPICVVTFAVHA